MPSLSCHSLSASDLPVTFGRYVLESVLGEGGMAKVFRAELKGPAGFRKSVALKVIKGGLHEQMGEFQQEMFLREARLGGLLRHPNLVDVYELGEVDAEWFLAMEWVDGLTLSDAVARGGALPAPVLLAVGRRLCAGLHSAHALSVQGQRVGLVHRDLKPSNVLVGWNGTVKIGDFGMAHVGLRMAQESMVHSSGGSPGYMSPEQWAGEAVDSRSDLFSLGCVLFELALGRPLFVQQDVVELQAATAQVESRLADMDEYAALNSHCAGLGDVVLGCLRVDPAARYAQVSEIGAELERMEAQAPLRPTLAEWLQRLQVLGGQGRFEDCETVDFDSLDKALPARASPPARLKTNLGEEPNTFVGRETELAELGRLLTSDRRLVTVLGPPGTGKTRLVKRFGAMWCTGVRTAWFCDLAEVKGLLGVVEAVARVLDMPEPGATVSETVLAEQVSRHLVAQKDLMLILDNVEQVADVVGALVRGWWEASPDVRFVVTSRIPLRLDVEQRLHLAPLPIPVDSGRSEEAQVANEAVQLFVERAQAVRPSFAMTPDNLADIVAIVSELDGLPLAIELAAARVRMWSPAVLRQRLGDRFRTLVRPDASGPGRQATLRGAQEWSWDLLAPWERSALAQCSVFRGGFGWEAAEAVVQLTEWPEAPWVVDVLGALVEHSLLQVHEAAGESRLAMYGSLSAYAAEKLTEMGEDVRQATEDRHRAHFEQLGQKATTTSFSGDGSSDGEALTPDLANLLAAVERGMAAGREEEVGGALTAAMSVMRLGGVGGYQVDATLGSGGAAVVYKVRGPDGALCALKLLSTPSAVLRTRMRQEGMIQRQLKHPNIVSVLDVVEIEGTTGLVLEFVEGPTLAEWMRSERPERDQALAVFRQIVAGVAFAHSANVIHRDLKPSNVLLSQHNDDWIPKVTDFGIAKIYAEEDADLTRTGVMLGTARYMAPEQIRDARRADARSDVYSLGCILYELMCGQPVVSSTDLIEIHERALAHKWTDPADLVPGLPDAIRAAIVGALIGQADNRIGDCDTLIAVLDGRQSLPKELLNAPTSWPGDTLDEGSDIKPHPKSTVAMRLVAFLMVLGLLGVTAVAVSVMWSRLHDAELDLPRAYTSQRITASLHKELTPALGPNGEVWYMRFEPQAQTHDIWLRTADGQVRRLRETPEEEYYPRPSPDGQWVVVGIQDGRGEVWDRTGELVDTLPSAKVAWSTDSTELLVAKTDAKAEGTTLVRHAMTESEGSDEVVLTWPGSIRSLDWSSTGRIAIKDGRGLWVLEQFDAEPVLINDKAGAQLGGWESDGRHLIYIWQSKLHRGLWQPQTGGFSLTQTIPVTSGTIAEPDVGPDDSVVFADREQRTWLMIDQGEGARPFTDQTGVDCFSVSPDQKLLVTWAWYRQSGASPMVLRDNESGEERPLKDGSGCSAFSASGEALAYVVEGRKQLAIQHVTTQTTRLYDTPGVYLPEWSPDGASIVYRGETEEGEGLVLLNVSTGALSLLSQGDWSLFPSWSPDGRWIVGAYGLDLDEGRGSSHHVRRLEVSTGEEVDLGPIHGRGMPPQWATDSQSFELLVNDHRAPKLVRYALDGQVLGEEEVPTKVNDPAFWMVTQFQRMPDGTLFFVDYYYPGDVHRLVPQPSSP